MNGATPEDKCKRCGASPTILSHIIPAGIARDLKGKSKNIHMLSTRRLSKRQGTIPERGLLCASCDSLLGPIDNYGKKFLEVVTQIRLGGDQTTINVDGFDGAEVQRFALSILWRSSLSTRNEEGQWIVSPYMDAIQQHIFDPSFPLPEPIATFTYFYVDESIPAGDLITTPVRVTYYPRRFWTMVLRGVAFDIRRDHRSIVPAMKPLQLKKGHPPRLQAVPFTGSGIEQVVRRYASAERKREIVRQRG